MNRRRVRRSIRCGLGLHDWAGIGFIYASWVECIRCGKRAGQ